MKLQEIKIRLDAKQIHVLERTLTEKYFTEKQVLRILTQGFKLKRNHTDPIFRSTFNKFYALADCMLFFQVVSDPVQHSNLIKRLLAKQSFNDAVNEMYSHWCLCHVFKDYEIFPLFSDAPDGKIVCGNDVVHVEIKSRFPKFVEILNEMFQDLQRRIKLLADEDVDFEIELSQLTKLDKKSAKIVCDQFENEVNEILHSAKRKTNIRLGGYLYFDFVVLKLQINIRKKINRNDGFVVGLAKEEVESDRIWLQKLPQVMSVEESIGGMATFSGCVSVKFALDEKSKSFLADVVIKECIKRISNLPREPNMIVIYTDTLGNDHIHKYMQKIFETYVERHEKTSILSCYISNSSDVDALEFRVPFFNKGKLVGPFEMFV